MVTQLLPFKLPSYKTTSRIKQTINALLVMIVAAAWGYNLLVKPVVDMTPQISSIFPEAAGFEIIASNPKVYSVFREASRDRILGYVVVDSGQGFSGPIKVMVASNPEGEIVATRVVEHREWPTWFDMLTKERFYDQFVDQKITDPLRLGRDVEAITGATYSSRGVAEAIRKASHALAAIKFGVEIQEDKEQSELKLGVPEISVFLLWAVVILAKHLKKYRLRWLTMIAGVFVIGYWLKSPVTLSGLVGLSLGYFPSVRENLVWYMMMAGVLGSTILLGRNLYCFWLCPFGGIQELLALAGSGKVLSSGSMEKVACRIKYMVVWLGLMVALTSRVPTTGSYEPFGTAFSLQGKGAQWALLGVVLLMGLLVYRFWCRYACPVKVVIELPIALKRNLNKIFTRKKTLPVRVE
ncbi:hypothetical protein SY88_07905 [Clostridiales bacterium PH28_bin88]|nr:hypothetical protein SY88_07905 [Clostridiales bacterium PH28_bin88]